MSYSGKVGVEDANSGSFDMAYRVVAGKFWRCFKTL